DLGVDAIVVHVLQPGVGLPVPGAAGAREVPAGERQLVARLLGVLRRLVGGGRLLVLGPHLCGQAIGHRVLGDVDVRVRRDEPFARCHVASPVDASRSILWRGRYATYCSSMRTTTPSRTVTQYQPS